MRLSLSFFLSALILISSAWAAPNADLWDYWLTHDRQSTLTVDHSPWNRFLDAYLVPGKDGINRIDYGGVSAADKQALDQYIAGLAKTAVSRLDRPEQRAYWINLYNALTVQVILDHYPVESIRDIDISPGIFSGLFSKGPWDKKLVTIEGQDLSLNDIEHRILRPIWKDSRIHYTVNCAALGCPNLQPQAFTAVNTDTLMNKGAREYVNHPRGVKIEDGRLIVSSIYVWYQEDFGGNDRGVIEHLRRYAEPALRERLELFNQIGSHRYDWALNGVR